MIGAAADARRRCLFQVIQGAVLGPLTMRYSERSLLLLSIGVSALVGLAQVNTETHRDIIGYGTGP